MAQFSPTKLIEQLDVDISTLVGQANKVLSVKSDETGFQLASQTTQFFADIGTYIYPLNNSAVRVYDSGELMTLYVWKTLSSPATSAISGAYIHTTKTAGSNILNNVRSEYHITTTELNGSYECATANIIKADEVTGTGGAPFASWDLTIGPTTSSASRHIVGCEINVEEREGDQGLKTGQSGKWSSILQLVPESQMQGTGNGYNLSFGLAFWQSGHSPYPQIHIPLYWGEKSIAANGYGWYMIGGTSSSDDPSYAGRFVGHFDKGIDFSGVTFNSTNKEAIILGNLHAIVLGTARIWVDGNDLWFYDPNTGSKKLSTM